MFYITGEMVDEYESDDEEDDEDEVSYQSNHTINIPGYHSNHTKNIPNTS